MLLYGFIRCHLFRIRIACTVGFGLGRGALGLSSRRFRHDKCVQPKRAATALRAALSAQESNELTLNNERELIVIVSFETGFV